MGGNRCVRTCMEKKRYNDKINGVTLNTNGRLGCWCATQMSGTDGDKAFKTCFLVKENCELYHDFTLMSKNRLVCWLYILPLMLL